MTVTNWRPEDPKAIGIERWAGAVKAHMNI